jgi:hypothetical protein
MIPLEAAAFKVPAPWRSRFAKTSREVDLFGKEY